MGKKIYFWTLILAALAVSSLVVYFTFIRSYRNTIVLNSADPFSDETYTIGLLGTTGTEEIIFDGFKESFDKTAESNHFQSGYRKINVPLTKNNVINGAKFLAESGADIIITSQTEAKLIGGVIGNIPIISASTNDPVGAELLKNKAGEKGNIIYIDNGNSQTLDERLGFFLELAPEARRILVPRAADNLPEANSAPMAVLKTFAGTKGAVIIDKQFQTRKELNQFLIDVNPAEFDAILLYPDSFVSANLDVILYLTGQPRLKKPVIAITRNRLKMGAVLSYGTDYSSLGALAADLAFKVLNSKVKPSEIAIQKVSKFYLGLHQSAADYLGIKIPDSLRAKANFIEP